MKSSKSQRSKISKLPPAPPPREDILSFQVPCGGSIEEATIRTDQAHLLRTLEGPGIYKFVNGTVYEGSFVNSEICGYGRLTWPNGDIYLGEVDGGLRHGHGIFLTHDRTARYEGDWLRGQRHGQGVVTYGRLLTLAEPEKASISAIYTGEFVANCKHGQGRLEFVSQGQAEYVGEWRNH